MTTGPGEKLVVALDVPDIEQARRLVEQLHPHVGWFKVGSVLFTACGPDICRLVKATGSKLFLDLKFHDIPNTVRGAVMSAAAIHADMLTLHLSGGEAMLRAGVEAKENAGRSDLLLVGVTVLTHLTFEDFHSLFGTKRSSLDTVVALAGLARDSGLDGVVASALETSIVKRELGPELVVVTPGIRLAGGAKDDQTRVVTPRMAVDSGADYLVVGRPIVADPDPVAACRRIIDDMAG